jgi:hypothetical protein
MGFEMFSTLGINGKLVALRFVFGAARPILGHDKEEQS